MVRAGQGDPEVLGDLEVREAQGDQVVMGPAQFGVSNVIHWSSDLWCLNITCIKGAYLIATLYKSTIFRKYQSIKLSYRFQLRSRCVRDVQNQRCADPDAVSPLTKGDVRDALACGKRQVRLLHARSTLQTSISLWCIVS